MGAFDSYKQPGQDAQTNITTGGAFSGYKPPQSTTAPAASTPMPAAMTYDPSDPNAGWGSWALSKLHNAAVGGNLFNRVVQDSATFGGLDKAQSLVPGSPSVDQLRAQTEQSRKEIGPVASGIADVAGYAVGPGELKVGEGVGNLIGRGIVGRVGGSAVEGAGASALGTAGHGDTNVGDLLKSAATGGAVGAVTGALPGGSGPRPTTPSTADLQSTASGLFTPLKSKAFNASDVGNVMDRITSGMSAGDAVSMGPKLADMRDLISKEISNRGAVSADDIAKFQRELRGAAGGNDTRQFIANQYANALDKGVGPKTAADIAAANRASNIAKTSSDIEGWAASPSGAPKAVQSALENDPNFYKTQPGLFDALKAVGDRANPPSLGRKIFNYGADAAARSAIGAGGAYMLGQNPLAGAVTGATSKVLLPHGVDMLNTLPIKNSLLAAQHLNATGMRVDPSVYTSMGLQIPGMLARQTGYGLGASGTF